MPYITWMRNALLAGVSAIVLHAVPAAAAEQLVFTFGPLRPAFSIDELEAFAAGGRVPSSMRFYLNVSNTDPDVVRAILSEEFDLSLQFVDQKFNTLLGEFVLFQMGKIIHTPSRQANIQALRSALVLSVSDDNKISLIEFMRNYPTQELHIDGIKLSQVARNLRQVSNDIREVRSRIQLWVAVGKDFLSDLADCNCQ
jgi:hypothetical protein